MRGPTYPQAVVCGLARILPADTTGKKTVATGKAAGAAEPGGTKITGLIATSNDGTLAHVLLISILRTAVNYVIGAVNVPINSGTDGTAVSVNLLNSTSIPGLPVDRNGQRYLLLQAGDVLQVNAAVAVSANKEVDLVAMGYDFSDD